MGIDSCIWVGYGFVIPQDNFDDLLKKDPSYDGDYLADEVYTHDIAPRGFIYGKMIYSTEARCYLDDGNRDIVDLKKVLRIHLVQKKKIDKMARKCKTKATYVAVAMIS